MVNQESNLTWPTALELLRAVFSLFRALKKILLAITADIYDWEKRTPYLNGHKKYINEEGDKRPAKIINQICVRIGSDLL